MPNKDDKDVNNYDENGRTPLMNAAIVGDYDEVKRLLEAGADPNIKDNNWGTTKAVDFAGRKSKTSEVHKKIEKLLINTNQSASNASSDICQFNLSPSSSSISLSVWLYIAGFISLILAPFTGITVVTAAAFFVIAWILDH